MKYLTLQHILLSSISLFATSFAVNFNPSTGLTDYPSVAINTTYFTYSDYDYHSRTLIIPLRSVKKFGLDVQDANDLISEELFEGLDLRPFLVILSGRARILKNFDKWNHDDDETHIHEIQIARKPDNAANTICKVVPHPQDLPDSDGESDLGFDYEAEDDSIDIICTAYFLVESAQSQLEERISSSEEVLSRGYWGPNRLPTVIT